MTKRDCISTLMEAGISYEDATALRRISMTLHRWHELECGDSNDYASWTIARGRKANGVFEYDDNGTPFEERHVHSENKARYTPMPDRERGALKRLAEIMARYPAFQHYIQTDPRGCSLYILSPDTLQRYNGQPVDSIYNNGIAVYK